MNIDSIILKKQNNKKLIREEIKYIVEEFTNGNISKNDMSEFLMLVKNKGLSYKETFYLTEAMVNSGDIIDLSRINIPVVDKHSTGGVGDKTTLLVAAIVASLGIGVAKMSGRSLGFTGGTIDKLESITGYKTNLTIDEFITAVNKVGICLISQTEKIAVADKKIYALRDEIGAVESIPLIASSIMSKKIASGAKNIVIDLKVGNGAFMKDNKMAKKLSKTMIKIGSYYKRRVICVLTNMNVPLGKTIGNSLEVKEVINYFNGVKDKRLDRLVKYISACMVSLGKSINFNQAYDMVTKVIENNTAKYKFYEWIKNQGGDLTNLKGNVSSLNIISDREGYINDINAIQLAKLVHALGSHKSSLVNNINYGIGIEIKAPLYSFVKVGSIIGTIYYDNKIDNMENKFLQSFKIESIKSKESDIIISVVK